MISVFQSLLYIQEKKTRVRDRQLRKKQLKILEKKIIRKKIESKVYSSFSDIKFITNPTSLTRKFKAMQMISILEHCLWGSLYTQSPVEYYSETNKQIESTHACHDLRLTLNNSSILNYSIAVGPLQQSCQLNYYDKFNLSFTLCF